jgi:hypothetical protein
LDPSSVQAQKDSISAIGNLLDTRALNIVAGDFNFVEHPSDRMNKLSGETNESWDKKQTEAWQEVATSKRLREFDQSSYTCENSYGWSKIDRAYTSMHAANCLMTQTFCAVLEHPRHLSDHCPISFGVAARVSNEIKPIPGWVTAHANFEAEVHGEFDFRIAQHKEKQGEDPDSMMKLSILKDAIKAAAKHIKQVSAREIAQTTTHKLSCTLGFIRAVEIGNMEVARRMQTKYVRLQMDITSCATSCIEFRSIKDHAVELMHTDIADRVRELKSCRDNLPQEIFKRRKDCIARRLARLRPAGSQNEITAMSDGNGDYVTQPLLIAELLKDHWQHVFNSKKTDDHKRQRWLQYVSNKLKCDLADLRPTLEDVVTVLKNLSDSAAGPDGISNIFYKHLNNIASDVFLEVVNNIIDGGGRISEEFNLAFLCCIPKVPGGLTTDGIPIFTAGSTRPISIVDAANRIVASVLKTTLERCVGSRISEMQRGFVAGRQMLMNLIDVDFAAQKISIKSRKGAILLFDFRAAFPSMNHDFIWDTLREVGIPEQFIEAIRTLYRNNKHLLKLRGGIYEGPEVFSGVRQGCPLSGLLFAICADVLLTRLGTVLRNEDEIVRAFADDTAAVVHDYTISIPVLANLFKEYEEISGLALNISKTVFIPLWPMVDARSLRNLVKELCPIWKNIKLNTKGKYLGFQIGPGAKASSWVAPLDKYNKRVEEWGDSRAGMFWNSIYYNTFVVTTLEFVAQLEDIPEEVKKAEEQAMRRLAPGPGNWVVLQDLENLDLFGIGKGFRLIECTACASKLRLLSELGSRTICRLDEELRMAQSNHLARPFGAWHRKSFVHALHSNAQQLRAEGISIDSIRGKRKDKSTFHFQKEARLQITIRQSNFDLENRIRHKIARWKLPGPPAIVAARCVRLFTHLGKNASPAVCAGYFRALWNGWPTSARMRSMQGAGPILACVFNCSCTAEDRIEHYARCPIIWQFLATPGPMGPGFHLDMRGIACFFGLAKEMSEEQRLKAARAVHAVGKVVMYRRHGTVTNESNFVQALRLEWRKQA